MYLSDVVLKRSQSFYSTPLILTGRCLFAPCGIACWLPMLRKSCIYIQMPELSMSMKAMAVFVLPSALFLQQS